MSKLLQALVLSGASLVTGNAIAQSRPAPTPTPTIGCNQSEVGNCNVNNNHNVANGGQGGNGGEAVATAHGGAGGEAVATGGTGIGHGGSATGGNATGGNATGGSVNGSGNSEVAVNNRGGDQTVNNRGGDQANTLSGSNNTTIGGDTFEAAANVASAASTFALKDCVGHRSFAFSVVAGGFGWNSTPSGAVELKGTQDGKTVSFTVPEFVALTPAQRAEITETMSNGDAKLSSCLTSKFHEQLVLQQTANAGASNVAQIKVDGQIVVEDTRANAQVAIARIGAAGDIAAQGQVKADPRSAVFRKTQEAAVNYLFEGQSLAGAFQQDDAAAQAARERLAAARAAREAAECVETPEQVIPAKTCPKVDAPTP